MTGLTFPEHLSEAFDLSLEECEGLFEVAQHLDVLRDNRRFWNGLRAWTCRAADKLCRDSAAQTGGEPSALILGRAKELRALATTLRETLAAIDAEGHRWKVGLQDSEPATIDDGF